MVFKGCHPGAIFEASLEILEGASRDEHDERESLSCRGPWGYPPLCHQLHGLLEATIENR